LSKPKGTLFVITAPSGAGKTSLIDAIMHDDPSIKLSVSYTTRAPRRGEEEGVDYHYVDDATFLAMRERDEFLESAEVHGNRYGTSKRVILDAVERGEDLILEIDWQGAGQVRAAMPECISIFILPPSRVELERRLRARGTDTEPVIQRRLSDAAADITHWRDFDYVVVNDDFERATAELADILEGRGSAARGSRPGLAGFVKQLTG
jgi:guanylate kinase